MSPTCFPQRPMTVLCQDCIELSPIHCIRITSDEPVTLETSDEMREARRAEHDAVSERGHADPLGFRVEEGDENVELRDGKSMFTPERCVEVREYAPVQQQECVHGLPLVRFEEFVLEGSRHWHLLQYISFGRKVK